jgi:predicted porin
MNKKLVAVAVAGAFAAPTAALAQSSVTISGMMKGGFENLKINNSAAARNTAPAGNTSQTGVVDDSSRIVFNVVEDLGGGLQAIVQLDMRIKADDAGGANTLTGLVGGGFNTSNIVSGNSHWGLRSKQWGRIFFGRQDLHYFNTESNLSDKASLRASSVSLLSYIGGSSVASASRTQNVVHYTTPDFGGFTLIAAYSSNPGGQETDIGSGVRKGNAWNLNPNFAASNWQVGYSYWRAKPDGTQGLVTQITGPVTAATGILFAAAAPVNQRADRLYGSYVFPMGLKVGLAWDKSKFTNAVTGVDTAKRNAWSLPISYTWGNHSVHWHYSKAQDEKVAAGDQSAKMWALAYAYDLSKRTSVALTYAQINNATGGTYNFFTSTSLGLGGSAGGMNAGEKPRMWGLTLRHAF